MTIPTDIAAVRALAEEAGRGLTLAALQAVAGGADRSFEMATLAQNTVREYHALTTALRAACDEVERLREALAIEQERRVVTASTMAEHIEDVRTAFVEGMQCAGMTEDGTLEMWQHSAALGKLRDIGAFEQAQGGNP